MRNKKGFTLVEIIAVIALIGVVMLLITPNIINVFKSAKKQIFYDEVLTLYNNAYTTYVYRSSNGDYNKRFCVDKNGSSNGLDTEEKEGLYYDITVNAYGEIISLKVSDNAYGISKSSSSGLKKKSIKLDDINDPVEINCGGSSIPDPGPSSLTCIITNSNRECNIFDFSYNVQNGTL